MNKPVAACFLLFAGAALAADGLGAFSIVVRAGGFDERCLKIAAGESIHFAFRADAPVDFNIHFHAGKDVHYPIRQAGVRDSSGTFRAERTEDYCLMWEASSRAVRIEGSLERSR
jgi:hypothetical protein